LVPSEPRGSGAAESKTQEKKKRKSTGRLKSGGVQVAKKAGTHRKRHESMRFATRPAIRRERGGGRALQPKKRQKTLNEQGEKDIVQVHLSTSSRKTKAIKDSQALQGHERLHRADQACPMCGGEGGEGMAN